MPKIKNEQPPFGLKQETVNDLFLLQRRDIEFNGLIEKEGPLKDVRRGESSSVQYDIVVDKLAYDFHTHPTHGIGTGNFGSKKITDRESKCADETAIIRFSTISGADAFPALQIRPAVGKMPSLMVSEKKITKYELGDPEKYREFKENLKDDGEGAAFESNIKNAIKEKYNLLKRTITRKQFEEQKFSMCDDRNSWKKLKKEWYDYLESIGLNIEEQPAKFKIEK